MSCQVYSCRKAVELHGGPQNTRACGAGPHTTGLVLQNRSGRHMPVPAGPLQLPATAQLIAEVSCLNTQPCEDLATAKATAGTAPS